MKHIWLKKTPEMPADLDRLVTVFSPEGRLYQVEYSFKAINSCGLNAIAIQGEEGVVVLSQKKTNEPLIKPESIHNVFSIAAHVGCAAIGRKADIDKIVYQLQEEAGNFSYKFGYEISAELAARRLANRNQVYTQTASLRLPAVTVILVGIEEETRKPELFVCDPAGHYLGYTAVGCGPKGTELMTLLEKKTNQGTTFPSDKTSLIKMAVETLGEVTNQDLAPESIDVGFILKEDRKFRKLSEEEIAGFLLNKEK